MPTNEELALWQEEKDLEEMPCDVCGAPANTVLTASDGERIPVCDMCLAKLL